MISLVVTLCKPVICKAIWDLLHSEEHWSGSSSAPGSPGKALAGSGRRIQEGIMEKKPQETQIYIPGP